MDVTTETLFAQALTRHQEVFQFVEAGMRVVGKMPDGLGDPVMDTLMHVVRAPVAEFSDLGQKLTAIGHVCVGRPMGEFGTAINAAITADLERCISA